MRNKAGTACMLLAAVLLLSALGLFIHNQLETAAAQRETEQLLPQLIEQIDRNQQPEDTTQETFEGLVLPDLWNVPEEYLEPKDFEMTRLEIDGYDYIGYLSIPSLQLELPIMADWDYSRLKIAPCRYYGSIRGKDLVLMAHNYASHFGKLSELAVGEQVRFTDMDGTAWIYQVVAKDILDPYAVEEMTAGDYDLTLFTCTYGGRSRVTVYCDLLRKE